MYGMGVEGIMPVHIYMCTIYLWEYMGIDAIISVPINIHIYVRKCPGIDGIMSVHTHIMYIYGKIWEYSGSCQYTASPQIQNQPDRI